MDVIAWILFGTFVALIPLLFRAGRAGSYRRGQGYYLDVGQPEEGPLPAYLRPERSQVVSRREIQLRLVAGLAFLVLTVITIVPLGAPIAAGLAGVVALVFLGGAFTAWRENKWLRGPRR